MKVTKRDYATEDQWKNWLWKSEGDLMMSGAFFVPSGNPKAQLPFSQRDMIKAKPGTYVTRLTRFSGAVACRVGRPEGGGAWLLSEGAEAGDRERTDDGGAARDSAFASELAERRDKRTEAEDRRR